MIGPNLTLKTQERNTKKLPKRLRFLLLSYCLLPPAVYLRGLCGIRYDLLTKGEKSGVCFTVVQHVRQAPSQVDSCSIGTPF